MTKDVVFLRVYVEVLRNRKSNQEMVVQKMWWLQKNKSLAVLSKQLFMSKKKDHKCFLLFFVCGIKNIDS